MYLIYIILIKNEYKNYLYINIDIFIFLNLWTTQQHLISNALIVDPIFKLNYLIIISTSVINLLSNKLLSIRKPKILVRLEGIDQLFKLLQLINSIHNNHNSDNNK